MSDITSLQSTERNLIVAATVWHFRGRFPDEQDSIVARLDQTVSAYLEAFGAAEQIHRELYGDELRLRLLNLVLNEPPDDD